MRTFSAGRYRKVVRYPRTLPGDAPAVRSAKRGHSEAAQRYINFLCSYAAGVANANYTGYTSPLESVAQNKGELYYHYSCDPGVYPSQTVLQNYEEYLYLGTATQAVMDNYWKSLKKSEGGVLMYLALGGVLVLATVILVYRKLRQKKLQKLQQKAREEYDNKKKTKK